jgi:hypothetical protein
MRKNPVPRFSLLLAALCCFVLPGSLNAQQHSRHTTTGSKFLSPSSPTVSGIKEIVPDKYKERYLAWKNDFISTETGRRQWESYEQRTDFLLTIVVSNDNHNGAGSGKYKWDESGKLIAATITLGSRINEGYPNPIYYPVMNALAPSQLSFPISGLVLAAAKIAHEFGHMDRMAKTNGALFKLQSQLVPAYNKILLSNGRNTKDPRLIQMAKEMGGTPVEIWEDREYWGEANAMRYLRDRISKESEQRALFTKIKRTVGMYAANYTERFDEIGQ